MTSEHYLELVNELTEAKPRVAAQYRNARKWSRFVNVVSWVAIGLGMAGGAVVATEALDSSQEVQRTSIDIEAGTEGASHNEIMALRDESDEMEEVAWAALGSATLLVLGGLGRVSARETLREAQVNLLSTHVAHMVTTGNPRPEEPPVPEQLLEEHIVAPQPPQESPAQFRGRPNF